MIKLIDEFNAKSNIVITLDSVISFDNIRDVRFQLYEAKKQIKMLEKILTCIYDEYALLLEVERDNDIIIQSTLQTPKEN